MPHHHHADVEHALHEIKEMLKKMPTRADLDAAKAALKQAITDATTRIVADIQSLKDQIAAGTPITAADLQDLQDDIAAVAHIDPPAV
jgi:N-methylhydantoinase B/oxoprolinase/acetone carboxylase alpha subunit